MPTLVALLRAVNLVEKNRVPMAGLRASLASLGYEDVRTYLQSGNVVFRAPAAKAKGAASAIERRIADEFGVSAGVLVRTPAELRKVAGANPFAGDESDPVKLHVVFLERRPSAKATAALDAHRSPPDRFRVKGREIYLHLPNGAARSKLTLDYFERTLGVKGTARNSKTLAKLVALSVE